MSKIPVEIHSEPNLLLIAKHAAGIVQKHVSTNARGDFEINCPHINGSSQSVIRLGEVPLGKALTAPYVLKLERTHADGAPIAKGYAGVPLGVNQEMNYLYFRHLGLPVVPHFMVGSLHPDGLYGVITPDLTASGEEVHEADGYNFSKISNGIELKKELAKHVKILEEQDRLGLVKPKSHIDKNDAAKPYVRTFYVLHDKATNSGRLVMGDLNHVVVNLSKIPPATKNKNAIQAIDSHGDDLTSAGLAGVRLFERITPAAKWHK